MEEGNKGYQRDLGREREMNETFLKMGKNKNENKKNEKLLLKICLFFETFYKMCKQKNENDYHKITIFLKEWKTRTWNKKHDNHQTSSKFSNSQTNKMGLLLINENIYVLV